MLGGVVSVKDYLEEVDEMSTFMETTKKRVLEQIASEDKEDSELRISRLQWSIDGVLYHMQRMIDVYMIIFREVETRVFSIQEQQKVVPDMLLMYNQDMPHLYHEMYAFANMYRISLDYFPKVLHHKFTNKRNLPKSISSFKSKTTDCSTLERLAQDQFVAYFKDLRDFINHDRSFAIGQNAIIRKDDVDESQVDDVVEHGIWTMMLNGVYRIDGKNRLVFNIYLPDKLYENEFHRIVQEFTYSKKINILAHSMRAARQLTLCFAEVALWLTKDRMFTYKKDLFERAQEYGSII